MGFERAKAAVSATRFRDLRWVAETGSTNSDVLDDLRRHPDRSEPLVLVADHQTAGRGRLARDWQAPPGTSVLMTIALPAADLPPARRPLLSAALAAAVTDVVPELRLKWPNDLVVDAAAGDPLGYRKAAGILAESHHLTGGADWVLLGIGINANWPEIPGELEGIATSLDRVTGHEVDREQLVADVLTALDRRWLPLAADPQGVQSLLDACEARSATVGGRVRVTTGAGELVGQAMGLTDEGALVVLDDDGTRHVVTAGDVVHLRPTD